MSHGSFIWPGVGGGSTCPAPMTRADLLTLRAASGLSTECVYTITDYVVGTLGAGTRIQLHATSATTLSENASVLTTFDNEAWTGTHTLRSPFGDSIEDPATPGIYATDVTMPPEVMSVTYTVSKHGYWALTAKVAQ